jgi:hypothetical protein
MAIIQSSLAEEILSRQERAVIRGIYRASQLADALVALDKATSVPKGTLGCGNQSADSHKPEDAKVTEIRAYLAQAIEGALKSINVPSINSSVKKDNSSKQT